MLAVWMFQISQLNLSRASERAGLLRIESPYRRRKTTHRAHRTINKQVSKIGLASSATFAQIIGGERGEKCRSVIARKKQKECTCFPHDADAVSAPESTGRDRFWQATFFVQLYVSYCILFRMLNGLDCLLKSGCIAGYIQFSHQ